MNACFCCVYIPCVCVSMFMYFMSECTFFSELTFLSPLFPLFHPAVRQSLSSPPTLHQSSPLLSIHTHTRIHTQTQTHKHTHIHTHIPRHTHVSLPGIISRRERSDQSDQRFRNRDSATHVSLSCPFPNVCVHIYIYMYIYIYI